MTLASWFDTVFKIPICISITNLLNPLTEKLKKGISIVRPQVHSRCLPTNRPLDMLSSDIVDDIQKISPKFLGFQEFNIETALILIENRAKKIQDYRLILFLIEMIPSSPSVK